MDQLQEQMSEMLTILRKQVTTNSELAIMLRDEVRDTRRITNELISVLGDLRDELMHMRTTHERDDRFNQIRDEARARAHRVKTKRIRDESNGLKTKAPK
jgi:hypothetical protein